ncbi:putative transcriptional regulator SLK3 [Abeliophyllum distichum]|uniref:Transcriptional regulator SLK3 n=1 Tax=Abeliophyllum distichum TaxID=126358 RepID=A0ABD1TWD1_9LAMI
MALEAFLDRNSQLGIPRLLPINGSGGILESLSSNSSHEREGHLGSLLRMAQLDANLASDVLNSTARVNFSSLGPEIGENTSVANADLTFPSCAHLHRNGSTNMEPYISLSASSVSFSLNFPMNASSTEKTFTHLCQRSQQERKRKQLEQAAGSTDLSKSTSQTHQVSHPVKIKQDPDNLAQILKKSRVDINQDDIQQQQIIKQFLLRQQLVQVQEYNSQLKELTQQHSQKNQLRQQSLHSIPQLSGDHSQQPAQQMRPLLQDLGNQHVSFANLFDGDICSQRFMQYQYHLRNRPNGNNICYWRKFVSEYYAPGSKKRWCLSMYENIEQHALGVFSPKSMGTWCCDVCGSRSGKGLEATFEMFPRLFTIMFESGMVDEIFFLEMPRACRLSSGFMILEYGKAVQESVYENFRVVREGKLRIVFRHDLKILSWEFCARHHDEYLPHRLVASQVNQLVFAAQKYHDNILDCSSDRVSARDRQSTCNMFAAAGHQLARNMELPLVNDLGFPKRFIRSLQIAEVVNSMKELISLSHDRKIGPIESLNNYSQVSRTNLTNEKQGMEQSLGAENLPIVDNRAIAKQPCPGNHVSGLCTIDNRVLFGTGEESSALDNYHRQLLMQNTYNASDRTMKKDDSCKMNCPSQLACFGPQSSDSHRYNDSTQRSLLRVQSSEHGIIPQQGLIDKLLNDMVAAGRGKSVQAANERLKNEGVSKSYQNISSSLLIGHMDESETGNGPSFGKSRDAASPSAIISGSANITKATSDNNSPAVTRNITIKTEAHSPEFQLPEAFQSLPEGFSLFGDLN